MDLRAVGKYRIGQKLGSGSFGEIYRGTNPQNGEEVAIKLESVKSKHPQLLYESGQTCSASRYLVGSISSCVMSRCVSVAES